MNFHIFTFCAVVFLGLIIHIAKERKEKFYEANSFAEFMLMAVPVLLAFCLRSKYVGGYDPVSYVASYQNVKTYGWSRIFSQPKDIGYLVFTKLLSYFFSNPQWLFIFIAVFFVVSYGILFSKTAKNSAICLICVIGFGLYVFAFCGLRQVMAMCICCFAYLQIQKKSLWKFGLIILLAFFFHASALFFIPAYFFGNLKNNRTTITVTFLGSAVFLLNIEAILSFIGGSVADYSHYGIESTGNGWQFFFVMLLITVFGEMNKAKVLEKNPDAAVFININYLSFTIWAARLITRTAERPFFYYLPASIIMLEHGLQVQSSKNRYIYNFLITVAALIFLIRRMGIVEYSFFWQ